MLVFLPSLSPVGRIGFLDLHGPGTLTYAGEEGRRQVFKFAYSRLRSRQESRRMRGKKQNGNLHYVE